MSAINNPRHGGHNTIAMRAASLFAIFCILASIAMVRDGRLFSFSIGSKSTAFADSTAAMLHGSDSYTIHTDKLDKGIIGYAGPVPLNIYITDGRIDSVRALPNTETPSFFAKASALLSAWDGMTVEEARNKQVDAVSSATYSSKAIIGNMHAGLDSIANSSKENDSAGDDVKIGFICALLVAFAAAILPLFIKNKWYRIVQQVLNVAVLGFWTGTFLDYTIFLKVFANGIPFAFSSLLMILLFVVAFLYPLFGRSSHYCAWVCPLGSLQELCSHVPLPELHLSVGTVKVLTTVRNILWCLLIISLWTGLFASWIDYELFTAFIVKSASTVVLIVGVLFIILSLFIMRPFCRFVCPVGSLLNHSENRN
ncbi:MAG: FMN-binding protein [Muribaculaceae bacterium]|nr:FMN-binding protein [Muribaculaceae bacterium]